METILNNLKDNAESEAPDKLLKISLNYAYHLESVEIANILTRLAGICQTEFSEEIETAAIGVKNSSVHLWFNRKFVYEQVKTPECLLFVLCHELFHKINGDIYKKSRTEREKDVANFAYDLVINRILCKSYFKKPIKLLGELYSDKPLPFCLLSHPDFLDFKKLLDSIKDKRLKEAVVNLYSAVWEKNGSSSVIYELVWEIFGIIYGESQKIEITVILLGDHKNGMDNKWLEWLAKKLGKDFLLPGRGTKRESFKINPQEKKVAEFYRTVIKAIAPDSRHPVLKEKIIPEMGFLPFLGRREIFLMQNGFQPMVYPNPVVKKEFDDWRTHIYVDVSGSTNKYWNVFYGLIIAMQDKIGSQVYIFSNEVSEITLAELKDGKLSSTGGTDLDCVAEHSLKNKFKRVLILTDGYFNIENGLKKIFMKETEIFFAIANYVKKLSSEVVELAGGEEKENIKWWFLPDIFETEG